MSALPLALRMQVHRRYGVLALHVFGGFLLGMLSMYIATRLYGMPRNSSHA